MGGIDLEKLAQKAMENVFRQMVGGKPTLLEQKVFKPKPRKAKASAAIKEKRKPTRRGVRTIDRKRLPKETAMEMVKSHLGADTVKMKELVSRTALLPTQLRPALETLVELGEVIRDGVKAKTTYRLASPIA